MAVRVAWLVPGIMGSRLFRRKGPKNRRDEIWGEDFLGNYKRIITDPASLQWTQSSIKYESELLECVYPMTRPWPKIKLWEGLLQRLAVHEEFGNDKQMRKYSYDWRQSLLDTARDLGQHVNAYTKYLAEERGLPCNQIRHVFLTHSMGGLVVRIALALGALDPSVVDRILHIGTPLKGSASAFRSAYHTGGLPLMQTLYQVFYNEKNAATYWRNFLVSVRSFPSVYQLMPPRRYEYLVHETYNRSNPLRGNAIEVDMRDQAVQAHKELRNANQIIRQRNVRIYNIYCYSHRAKPTDLEYEVFKVGRPSGYLIKTPMPYQDTEEGDGTVSTWSADGGQGSKCIRIRVKNVDHMTMCDDVNVVEKVMDHLD
jgi:Lecithin:cholesterol acyltransferase